MACLYELNAEQESGLRPWTRQDLQRFAPQTSKIGSAQRALNRAQTLHRARGSLDALGLDLGEAGVREALASLFRLGHACEWDDAALREAVLGRYLKDRGRWQRA